MSVYSQSANALKLRRKSKISPKVNRYSELAHRHSCRHRRRSG